MENKISYTDVVTPLVERVKSLISEMGCTQYEFAEKIGVNASNLSKHLNGKLPINDSLINKIVVNLGVSKKWLKDGVGEQYCNAMLSQVILDDRGSGSLPTRGTPVYDIDVTAGPVSRSMIFAQENVIGYIDMPSIPDDCRVVKVSGDSMTPVINNGDYLAVRELRNPDMIFWGQIYVVLLEDYRMVKYLRKHTNPQMVILRSENPRYDDLEIYRKDIKDIMVVHSILHIDSRM